jgi:very-short-patch-repair endonuclease
VKGGPRGFQSNLGSIPPHARMVSRKMKRRAKRMDFPMAAIRRFEELNRLHLTAAEARFERILSELNGGVLAGRFKCQHAISGKWIVDFFFPEIRLAVEIDGSVHELEFQQERDAIKDADCVRFDITLIRITNAEVFGPRADLISLLRRGWAKAKARENRIIGRPYPDIK